MTIIIIIVIIINDKGYNNNDHVRLLAHLLRVIGKTHQEAHLLRVIGKTHQQAHLKYFTFFQNRHAPLKLSVARVPRRH